MGSSAGLIVPPSISRRTIRAEFYRRPKNLFRGTSSSALGFTTRQSLPPASAGTLSPRPAPCKAIAALRAHSIASSIPADLSSRPQASLPRHTARADDQRSASLHTHRLRLPHRLQATGRIPHGGSDHLPVQRVDVVHRRFNVGGRFKVVRVLNRNQILRYFVRS